MRVSGVRSSFSNADENTQRKRNREAPFRFLATLIRPCDIFILDAFLYFFNKYIFDFAVDVGRISRTFMSVYVAFGPWLFHTSHPRSARTLSFVVFAGNGVTP